MGNCNLLNGADVSVGMRGMKTSSPLKGPVKIVASMKLIFKSFTASRVPLQSTGGLIFRSIKIGTPTLNFSSCGGNPGRSSAFKNSVGKLTASTASDESLEMSVWPLGD